MPDTPATIDPEFIAGVPTGWEVGNNIYDEKIYYLTDRAAGSRDFASFENRLFERLTPNEDGTVWTAKLRQGVMNHLGNEFNAADVKWSFDRAFGLQGLGFFLAIQVSLTSGDNVRVVDDYTVEFHLDQFSPLFQDQMALMYHANYDSDEVIAQTSEDDPWATGFLGNNGIGFGPYYLEEFTAGQQLVLKANPNYYGGKPAFDTIIYRAVPDPANRLALLQAGEVDIALGLSPEQLAVVREDSNLSVTAEQGNTLVAAVIQASRPPLDNTLVRQALNYATPSSVILGDVFQVEASDARSFLPPRYRTYTDEFFPYTFDPGRAQQLLTEAGIELPLDLSITYAPFDPSFERLAVALRSAWEEVGVNLTLNQVTPAVFQQVTADRDFDVLVPPALSAHIADPIYTMEIFAGGSRSCCNWGNYVNDEAFAFYDEAAVETDPAARDQDSVEIQRVMGEDPPWVVMGVRQWSIAHSKNVANFIWNPQESIWFHELTPGS
ncbi:MAG: ABC transporter substrate-binding protein [Actinomycetia bacterium]|nr:ABC transporter substrate-binding protein [Actinomycetes bacterium]